MELPMPIRKKVDIEIQMLHGMADEIKKSIGRKEY